MIAVTMTGMQMNRHEHEHEHSHMIWVTPQSGLCDTLRGSGAKHVVGFTSPGSNFSLPGGHDLHDCLILTMNDISEPGRGLIMPACRHVESLLDFDRALSCDVPLVLTCHAGISRSTAAAYILLCRRQPEHDEVALATMLRRLAPFATPNARLIALADKLLKRDGRMSAAIRAIGRGADAFAGTPFSLG